MGGLPHQHSPSLHQALQRLPIKDGVDEGCWSGLHGVANSKAPASEAGSLLHMGHDQAPSQSHPASTGGASRAGDA